CAVGLAEQIDLLPVAHDAEVADLLVQERLDGPGEILLLFDRSGECKRPARLAGHLDGEIGALGLLDAPEEDQARSAPGPEVERLDVDAVVDHLAAPRTLLAEPACLELADRGDLQFAAPAEEPVEILV